jgi:outer membrane protein assembly factor BamB
MNSRILLSTAVILAAQGCSQCDECSAPSSEPVSYVAAQPAKDAAAGDSPQFRGPNRDGIFLEKGLLQSWPKEGPKLLWTYRNAGLGFSSYSIVGDMMYTMGGFGDDEYVIALKIGDMKLEEVWKTKVGKLFSYQAWGDGPRSTPTVAGNLVLALGGYGDLVCVDRTKKGEVVWRKSFPKDLDGEIMSEWGYSESVLVDGDRVICTPGGDKGTLAALDLKSGKPLWRSKKLTNKAPYSSVMMSMLGKTKYYIQTSYISEADGGVVSAIGEKGDVFWTKPIFEGHSYAIAPNPTSSGNLVYITAGYGGGCHLFELNDDNGKIAAKDLYKGKTQKAFNNTHGGVVLIDGHIYGHSETQLWMCQEMKTGAVKWKEKQSLPCRSGATVAADGRLYLYSEDGGVGLLEPSPEAFKAVGTFDIPETSKLRKTVRSCSAARIWAHPVVCNGRLYLRDMELIFCYDVKAKK